VEYLLFLQELRGGIFDSVLMMVTDFIGSPVIYVFLAVLYWCFQKNAAIFIVMNISVGSMVNQMLKNIFCVYRPWVLNPAIKPFEAAVEGATGYSFPSGHTQLAANEFLSIARWQKKRKWLVTVCIMITLLVMFTRNYLGVHTLWDVLASVLLACLVIFLDEKLINWIDKGKNRDLTVFVSGIILTLIGLAYMTLKSYPMDYSSTGELLVDPDEMIIDCYLASGCLSGFLTGWILERRFLNFSTEVSAKTRILRSVIGALLLLFLVFVVRDFLVSFDVRWGNFAFFFFTFVFILFIYPCIFVKTESIVKNSNKSI